LYRLAHEPHFDKNDDRSGSEKQRRYSAVPRENGVERVPGSE
jgi:hypothetical protein